MASEGDDEAAVASALAARVRTGDRDAEQALVERYSRGLSIMLRRRTGDPALAEDLHQEVFRIVIERLRERGLDEPAKLAAFIQSTGKNLVIGVIRRRQRRNTYADTQTVETRADDASRQIDEVAAEQQAEHVRTLLEELGSERDRAILIRFYLHQEEKASICEALALSDLHFNRVLYRAKKRFRALLEGSDSAIARELASGR